MSKQRNDNIGHTVCLLDGCSAHAAVRKNRSGKFYFDCPEHGRITPNLPEGQSLLMDSANIWGAEGPPADCARWIAEQWSWGRVMRDPEARKPVNGETPVYEAPPVDEGHPVEAPPRNGPGGPPPPPEPEPEKHPEPEAEPEEYEPAEDDFA